MLAFKAFYADVSPQPHHLPFITPAGVFLLEADYIVKFNLHLKRREISTLRIVEPNFAVNRWLGGAGLSTEWGWNDTN